MKLLDLNGSWTMTDLHSGRSLPAHVPGTVAATLLEQDTMPDPYWRENEVIDLYLHRDYHVPADFEDYVLLSQLQAAEGLSNVRRNSGLKELTCVRRPGGRRRRSQRR